MIQIKKFVTLAIMPICFFCCIFATRKLKAFNQMRNRFVLVILSLVVCFVTTEAAGKRSSSTAALMVLL